MAMLFPVVAILLAYAQLSISECIINGDEVEIQQVTEPVKHAEGPFWDDEENVLYYVDIAGFGLHRYDPVTNENNFITLNDTVSVVVRVEGERNQFLIGYGKTITKLTWDGKSSKYDLQNITSVDQDRPGNRFNDGKVGPEGRFWVGTMGEEKPIGVVKPNQGSLFKMDGNLPIQKVITPATVSNGLGWNKNNNLMYYIDSPTQKIDVFDFDVVNGILSNRRTLFDFVLNNITGVPDGMTVDENDDLWIACFGGSRVIQVSGVDGCLLKIIEFPVERVTSATFGGPDLSTLYVTTMQQDLVNQKQNSDTASGAVFAVTKLGVTGTRSRAVVLP